MKHSKDLLPPAERGRAALARVFSRRVCQLLLALFCLGALVYAAYLIPHTKP